MHPTKAITYTQKIVSYMILCIPNEYHLIYTQKRPPHILLLMVQKYRVHQLRLIVYPCIYRVLGYIHPRWLFPGFLNHQPHHLTPKKYHHTLQPTMLTTSARLEANLLHYNTALKVGSLSSPNMFVGTGKREGFPEPYQMAIFWGWGNSLT